MPQSAIELYRDRMPERSFRMLALGRQLPLQCAQARRCQAFSPSVRSRAELTDPISRHALRYPHAGCVGGVRSRLQKNNSTTAIVFPAGALITATPSDVAFSSAILSTPTPARPITFSLRAFSKRSAEMRV